MDPRKDRLDKIIKMHELKNEQEELQAKIIAKQVTTVDKLLVKKKFEDIKNRKIDKKLK